MERWTLMGGYCDMTLVNMADGRLLIWLIFRRRKKTVDAKFLLKQFEGIAQQGYYEVDLGALSKIV